MKSKVDLSEPGGKPQPTKCTVKNVTIHPVNRFHNICNNDMKVPKTSSGENFCKVTGIGMHALR